MKLKIHHHTSYRYESPAEYAVQVLRVTPAPHAGLRILHWKVRTSAGGRLLQYEDGFGNTCHIHTVTGLHDSVGIDVDGLVETTDSGGVVRGTAETLPREVWLRATALTAPSPPIVRLAADAAAAAVSSGAVLRRLMELVAERVVYRKGATDVTTTAADALQGGFGVCQDQAHVFLSAARALGIPARYVGGYLCTDVGGPAAGEGEPDGDQASHAWAEAFDDEAGWTGFDPANVTLTGPRHVRTAVGLDYTSAAPVRGVRRGEGGEALYVGVQVARLAEQ